MNERFVFVKKKIIVLFLNIRNYSIEIADVEFERDASIKQKKFAHLTKEVIPFYMEKLNAIAKENNGYMALGRVCCAQYFIRTFGNSIDFIRIFLYFQLTWADIEFITIMDMCNCWLGFDATVNYAHLTTVRNNVMSVDTIKEWYENRPKSDGY